MADFTWNLLHPTSLLAFIFPGKWQKPPSSFVKCNVGSSWDESSKIGGGACIVRDEKGSLNFVPFSCNNLANMITRDHRHQSYVVALHGPVWLASLIRQEASA
ncbi:hypothetical protein YC2023_018949 [Brassica napus]